MAGLVMLDADLEVVQQVPAVIRGTERWTRVPSARRAPREACRPRPRPSRLRASVSASLASAGRGSRARWPGAARRGRLPRGRPEQGPGQARVSRRTSTTRTVLSSGARYQAPSGSHGARNRAGLPGWRA